MADPAAEARRQRIRQLQEYMATPEFQQKQADYEAAQRTCTEQRVPRDDPDKLAAFDKEMYADEAKRFTNLDSLIRNRYGGIHPLYGTLKPSPAYDAARTLPLHAYPFERPDTQEGAVHQDYDYAHYVERVEQGRHPSGAPQAEVDALKRYAEPMESPSKQDCDRIDRHRHQAIKAQLEQNGFKLPGECLYPGTKYPLTGPPMKLESGHPLLNPESTPRLLSAVPELRNGQLFEDSCWLDESEKWTEERAKAEEARPWKQAAPVPAMSDFNKAVIEGELRRKSLLKDDNPQVETKPAKGTPSRPFRFADPASLGLRNLEYRPDH